MLKRTKDASECRNIQRYNNNINNNNNNNDNRNRYKRLIKKVQNKRGHISNKVEGRLLTNSLDHNERKEEFMHLLVIVCSTTSVVAIFLKNQFPPLK